MMKIAALDECVLASQIVDLAHRRDAATLYYHLGTLEDWCRRYASSQRGQRHKALFAVKICPYRPVLDLIQRHLHGYDITNLAELETLAGYDLSDKIISVCGAAVSTSDLATIIDQAPRMGRLIIVFDSLHQFERVHQGLLSHPNAYYMFRISETELKPGFWSKFGVRFSDVIVDERFIGLHAHMSRMADLRKVDVLLGFVRRCTEVSGTRWVNIGGGQHFYDWFELDRQLGQQQETIVIEPGHPLFTGGGFASGTVRAIKRFPDRIEILTNLSQVCHTEWSRNKVLLYPRALSSAPLRRVRVHGPLCCAEDMLTEVDIPLESDAALAYQEGDRIVFADISPASASLNRTFNGVARADVVFC